MSNTNKRRAAKALKNKRKAKERKKAQNRAKQNQRKANKPKPPTPLKVQQAIVARTEELFDSLFTVESDLDRAAACLYWTMCVIMAAKEVGIKLEMLAGTHSYPCIDLAQDDGVQATHFTYLWEGLNEVNRGKLMRLEMPEMHVWAYRQETGEVIDLTTKYLPQQCENRAGIKWTGDTPPDYIWTRFLPNTIVYDFDPTAKKVADSLASATIQQMKGGVSILHLDGQEVADG